ncbi:hypothetical protein DM01DRAFT_1395485 [Hesseltinella vesiculosa]|uniref:Uncharacterized protein n=1 Tax=Hesseltinella vesiculosa TaxID=101127 RepID=A0A1X2GUP5_9FUNG|nr:hypothetical protein DM01DRAFT_1395485 [Hesseltinella vesiculosa]
MCDLHWCPACDKAIDSDSLYCSEQCYTADALRHHPLCGQECPLLATLPKIHRPPCTCMITRPAKASSAPPQITKTCSYSLSPQFNDTNLQFISFEYNR